MVLWDQCEFSEKSEINDGLDSYSRQGLNYLDPILIYISLWIDCLFENPKIAVCFFCLSLPGHYRVTDEGLLAQITYYDPFSFLWMFSLLLKERIFDFDFLDLWGAGGGLRSLIMTLPG